MPRSLHGELAKLAERDGTSLNQLITGTLASAIGSTSKSLGDGGAGKEEPTSRPAAPGSSRTLLVLLVVNAITVGLAALAAIGLLLYAWQG